MLFPNLLLITPLCFLAQALEFDGSSTDSIKSAAAAVASNLASYYEGSDDGTGLLPSPYYWWESGAMWNGLLDYCYMSGDDTFNKPAAQALLGQTGPNQDYMPPNQTKTEGNDDQGVWALAALSAAEYGVPVPDNDQGISNWTDLAVNTWNAQSPRWDSDTCGGGLRWQIYTFNNGYNYKNSASAGTFFQLSARLAALTGNSTYADAANKVWSWVNAVGLMSDDARIFDGTDSTENCSTINHLQWTENAGFMLRGASAMWSVDNSDQWKNRVKDLVTSSKKFFFTTNSSAVMYEVACASNNQCNTDQRAFRYFLATAMSSAAVAHPELQDVISPLLASSATGAAAQCLNNGTCGQDWSSRDYDGTTGVGEDLSALSVITGHGLAKGIMDGRRSDTNSTGSGSPTSNGNSSNTQPNGGTSSSSGGSDNGSNDGLGSAAALNGGLLAALAVAAAMAVM